MSITDPILKEFKEQCKPLFSLQVVKDSTPELIPALQSLEKIMHHGIISRNGIIPPPWMWLNAVSCEMDKGNLVRRFPYVRSVDIVRDCVKISTTTGKFRLLIRSCLVHNCLHVPVEVMVRELGERRLMWYHGQSIIGHEVLGEILLSVLLQISQLKFELDLNNSRFLDSTWQLPISVETTLVPCSSLGLVMAFLRDLAVVVEIDQCSVVAEDGHIEPGDIFDEFNGHIVTEELRGKLRSILNKSKNQPITLRVLKMNCKRPDKAYAPILRLYDASSKVRHLIGREEDVDEKPNLRPQAGYTVDYLGQCGVGRKGDVSLVEASIRKVSAAKQQSRRFRMECRELDVQLTDDDGDVFMRYQYMSIASCGHSMLFPHHFGFIVGNAECSIATEYTCHVFVAPNADTCATILLALGNGFQRTQCVV